MGRIFCWIRKEDPWTKIIVKTNSSQVEISVIDSGSGIEPEILERLMQPFFTTKPVGKGTGLGLSISKGVIEDHNGSFNYDPSYLNTCFTIRLPLAPKS
jgi:signal transduction histidine kinase